MNRKRRSGEILVGAYALNAVTDAEREEFEACAKRSERLRAEATELQDTAVLLGMSAAEVAPPDYLRTRILAQIEVTPQLTPDAERSQHAPRRLSWRTLVPTGFVVAGATAAIAIALPLLPVSGAPTQQNTVAAISAADDARDAQVQAGVANRVSVVWSQDLHEAAVRVDDTNLSTGNAYQLWLVTKGGAARSAGLVLHGDGGWHVLDGKLQAGERIMMTVEPVAGSKAPTTRPLFALST